MNKALLLIICDFLLISVLALVEFDTPEEETPPPDQPPPQIEEGMNRDMVELLQLSLESEEARRAALAAEKAELEAAREALAEERADLARNLEERETTLSLTEEERDRLAAERERLAREAAELARERETLAAAKAETEATLEETREERGALARDLEAEAERARALQAELQQRLSALAAAEATVAAAEERAAALEARTRTLSTDLQIARTERELLSENLRTARTEVEIARVERQRAEQRSEELAQGVTQLAEQTEAVQAEIRRAQPISSNEIFSRYERNRLTLQFEATVPAFLGTRQESSTVEAVLVRHEDRTYAVFEGSQGPFRLESLDRLRSISGRLVLGTRRLEIVEISLLAADPRLVAVQVPERYLAETGKEPFALSEDPFRFPQAVLISNQLGAYGETPFRLLPGGDNGIAVDRSLMSSLRGQFQPSRGDYVFAQTGRLLGLMVEAERGILLNHFRPAAHLGLGEDFDPTLASRLQAAFAPRPTRSP
jgi:hypothetical protein